MRNQEIRVLDVLKNANAFFTPIRNLLIALALLQAGHTMAQFTFVTNNGAITITKYTGSGGAVIIPSTTNGWPVVCIGTNAFKSSKVTGATIPNSVTNIEKSAFYGCTNLTNVTIPNSVTTIENLAFFRCTSLINVTIPNSVTSIGDGAFWVCHALTAFIVGSGVTNIGIVPFNDCTGLTSITVDTQNPVYSSTNGILYDKNQIVLIECPSGKTGSYSIPNSVTSIGGNAFYYCTQLISITIPNSVTNIGDAAFEGCSALTSITIPGSVNSIGSSVFASCHNLINITIPNSVTKIGTYTFYECYRLTNLTVGSGVTSIGEKAFYNCTSLTTLYFQGTAPNSGAFAFDGDAKLTIYYLPGSAGWGSTFGGVPAVLWNPLANKFGVTGGYFGFNITGPANAVIVVEACTNFVNPVWLPVSTNKLTGGASSFSDSQSGNHPRRFYRFRSP